MVARQDELNVSHGVMLLNAILFVMGDQPAQATFTCHMPHATCLEIYPPLHRRKIGCVFLHLSVHSNSIIVPSSHSLSVDACGIDECMCPFLPLFCLCCFCAALAWCCLPSQVGIDVELQTAA